jgi:hypothetical protein
LNRITRLLAVLAVVALAVPAAVSAKKPDNPGSQGVSKRCKHQPKVAFVLGGTLDPTSTAGAIVVVVTSSNKHSKPFVVDGRFALGADSSKATFAGSNPFTTPGADLTQYKVKVIGKVMKYKKGCTAANAPAPTIRKVTLTAPDAPAEATA